jgi:predicted ABC-type ATPase
VFAGPNGSGKTTIFKEIHAKNKINLGVYVNADDIEKELVTSSGKLSFDGYQLTVAENDLREFFRLSKFSPIKRAETALWEKLSVKNNVLFTNTNIDSYLAADLAEYLRQRLLDKGISFTYETVMSHESKVDFLLKAKQHGYRVYLYYIATEDPEINTSRVRVRVAQSGHSVSPDIIQSRYYKSLKHLKSAAINTNRAYIFDNSGKHIEFVAEITEGTDVLINKPEEIPSWVANYLLS